MQKTKGGTALLTGDKSTFAIEIELYEEHSRLLEGTLSYWINSERLGGDKTVYLSDVLMEMPWMIHDAGNRLWNGDPAADPDRIFQRLRHDIYDSETFEGCPARYNISIPWVIEEIVFCLEDDRRGYLLYKRYSDEAAKIFPIKKGEADCALKMAYSWLSELYDRESKVHQK